MEYRKYATIEAKRQLLSDLVSIPSVSGSKDEQLLPKKLQDLLASWHYYQEHQEHLHLGPSEGSEAPFVSALYLSEQTAKTIVFISHFDVVDTEDFGEFESLAFNTEELTQVYKDQVHLYSGKLREDILSGEYVFGRGSMDMKAGLAIQISMLEKAIAEAWPINIILLTVPDEEVNSAGMRSATKHLVHLKNRHHLEYELFLNSEPVFSQQPNDENTYIYSGSIGKIMPGVLCYGKETHVGEPLSGLTSNYMSSFITQQIEFNSAFRETKGNERTPLPVSLYHKDLKAEYSVQTPYRTVSLFNVFLFQRSAQEVLDIFQQEVHKATDRLNQHYQTLCQQEDIQGVGSVKVIIYEELEQYAVKQYGAEKVEKWKEAVWSNEQWDDREKSIRITDQLMRHCNELAPAVVTFFAPPYYPPVHSELTEPLTNWISSIQQEAQSRFDRSVHHRRYFNGISDLSYVAYKDKDGDNWKKYQANTPVFGATYTIPFEAMSQLQAPVLNIGPLGKDPHKSSERLHMQSAFVEVPLLIEHLLQKVMRDLGVKRPSSS